MPAHRIGSPGAQGGTAVRPASLWLLAGADRPAIDPARAPERQNI